MDNFRSLMDHPYYYIMVMVSLTSWLSFDAVPGLFKIKTLGTVPVSAELWSERWLVLEFKDLTLRQNQTNPDKSFKSSRIIRFLPVSDDGDSMSWTWTKVSSVSIFLIKSTNAGFSIPSKRSKNISVKVGGHNRRQSGPPTFTHRQHYR